MSSPSLAAPSLPEMSETGDATLLLVAHNSTGCGEGQRQKQQIVPAPVHEETADDSDESPSTSFISDSSHADASTSLLAQPSSESGQKEDSGSDRWATDRLGYEQRLERKSRSRRAWFLGTCMVVVLGLMVFLQYIDDLRLLKSSVRALTPAQTCEDPYTMPGYVWRSTDRKRMRWIPLSAQTADDEVRGRPSNHPIDTISETVLAASPPSLGDAFLDSPDSGLSRADDPRLAFLRGKKVVTMGCSLDRNALESMCLVLGQDRAELDIHRHGRSSCHFKDLDFTAEIWFHAGTREGEMWEGRNYTFESLMTEEFIPLARESGRAPDLLLLASATWDFEWLHNIAQATEHVAHLPLDPAKDYIKSRDTPLMPYEAYSYYRTRLRDMVHFVRHQFPGTPLMFRSQTYMNRGFNAEVYNMRQSAAYVMRQLDVPLFTWADKLIGEKDMMDLTHFSTGSAADWLYSDLMLYYLRHFVEERTFCEQ